MVAGVLVYTRILHLTRVISCDVGILQQLREEHRRCMKPMMRGVWGYEEGRCPEYQKEGSKMHTNPPRCQQTMWQPRSPPPLFKRAVEHGGWHHDSYSICCPFAGGLRILLWSLSWRRLKVVSRSIDADSKSSAAAVVADVKSSDTADVADLKSRDVWWSMEEEGAKRDILIQAMLSRPKKQLLEKTIGNYRSYSHAPPRVLLGSAGWRAAGLDALFRHLPTFIPTLTGRAEIAGWVLKEPGNVSFTYSFWPTTLSNSARLCGDSDRESGTMRSAQRKSGQTRVYAGKRDIKTPKKFS
ncbi:hypothetical protein BDZ89DRAFT_1212358 [Hymenopellis radicata]|nr:hypothetical protein BDZ89DRAFT_1212358 [Hymenopellis radicata]